MLLLSSLHARALEWPQEVSAAEGTIIVYQPQPEAFKGNQLSGRAAMALVPKSGGEQIFGTFWFTARVDSDTDDDNALVRDLRVTQVRWPESRDAGEQRFTAIVEAAIPEAGFVISRERLAASLATAELETRSLEKLNNDPPQILFREQLAVLLSYDGKPRYADIENSNYQRVVNAPIAVVRAGNGKHYVTNGKLWYQADSAMGPWTATSSPPADLVKAMPAPEGDLPNWPTPPEIVVATEPTELIVTDGAPEWTPLAGGEVLYVTNTESPWLRNLSTGNMYLLLSGRWFRAKNTSGPWTFVPADELPAAFADIPPASDIGGLRTSVAGTPEAEDAVLDAQIPQTAAISRDTTLQVAYEGTPRFEDIPGTSVAYAVNTGTQVLRVDGKYYAVDNGVWFTAARATGPWAVADSIPSDEIKKIPPSSPVYNTTYVNVYESTPEIVYVGYTPGYLWSFPYYGVPVYGSGWYYRPYPGPWYYPRPPTWGFNVGYNPWTGWSFGLSWSSGFFNFGVSWGGGYYHGHHHGWYGGGGYRGPVVINTGYINIGNNINVGNRVDFGDRINRNDIDLNRDGQRRDNLYNRAENRDRKADPSLVKRDLKRATSNSKLKNNVYADRDGRVLKHEDNQWQSRDKGGWKQDPELNRPATREATRPARQDLPKPATRDIPKPSNRDLQKPASRPTTHDRHRDLDRAQRARNHGAMQERNRPRPQRQSRNLRR
ncbi:carbohydrate-binding family V/XII [Pseudohalioglobus sediminis]|uniref:Carbohydrate-binding family V/XII n=2 Tax=Pseudohalioglobus sediminis TaxID=2606449 RepID=A0A5B0X5K0_9GAMM|nr:carbohydrate-binding family V/XII [Pseudohalioglobus sediminis]